MRTQGLSPKAILAFCYPLIAAVAGAVAAWIVNGGALSWNEIRIAAGGLVLSGAAGIGAYIGKPGDVVSVYGPEDQLAEPPGEMHTAS